VDQRIERSKSALRMAVLQLLQQKPYEDMTVEDIAHRAGVTRSTFYVHFEDKDELLRASLAASLELLSQLVAVPAPGKIIVAALEHMRGVRETSLAMLQGGAHPVIARTLASQVETRLGARGLHRPGQLLRPFGMLSQMLADAILVGIVEWLRAERPLPAEDLAKGLMHQMKAIIDASRGE